jgi:phosphoserine phosphatase
MSGPKQIAAFFDIDGTLLSAPSLEWRFIGYLLWRGVLDPSNILRWFAFAGGSFRRGRRLAVEANKQYLAGLPVSLIADWADALGIGSLSRNPLGILAAALNRVRWHQSQNHRVFLVSGTLAPLARQLANHLPGKVEVIATELEISKAKQLCVNSIATENKSTATHAAADEIRYSPVWTGRLAGEHIVDAAKSRALQAVATRNHLDLTNCYAYGNSRSDRAMLEVVGYPEAVNPSRCLEQLAMKRRWPVSRWLATDTTHVKAAVSGCARNPMQTEQSRA